MFQLRKFQLKKRLSFNTEMLRVFSKKDPKLDVSIIIPNQNVDYAPFIIHQVNKLVKMLRLNDYRYEVLVGSRNSDHTNFMGIDCYNDNDKNDTIDKGERSRGTAKFYHMDMEATKQLHKLHQITSGTRDSMIFIVRDTSFNLPERIPLQLSIGSSSFCDSNGLFSENRFLDSLCYKKSNYCSYI